MATARYTDEASKLSDAGAALAEQIREAFEERRRTSATGTFRIEVALPDTDPLNWLAAQSHQTRIYWTERDGAFETAALGVAHEIDDNCGADLTPIFGAMRQRLPEESPSSRYYGGLRFNNEAVAPRGDEWDSFGAYRFILPRFELTRSTNGAVLACHLSPDDTEAVVNDIVAEAEALEFSAAPDASGLRMNDRINEPDMHGWTTMIEQALGDISAGRLDKIALARRVTYKAAALIDPVALLGVLRTHTADSFRFCFQFDQGAAFLGASPERLYARNGAAIRSEAVAGTRPRSDDSEEDKRLGCELLESEKDNREQQIVADHVVDAMARLCECYSANGDGAEKRLLRMARVQHLVNSYRGELRRDSTDAGIIGRLHPTPAVGGSPSAKAMATIDRLEPFDRGWYAGPVGWIGADAAEFAVAIRSGLIAGDCLHLYSGAGIVAGSSPEQEWSEIEAKLGGFLMALGVA